MMILKAVKSAELVGVVNEYRMSVEYSCVELFVRLYIVCSNDQRGPMDVKVAYKGPLYKQDSESQKCGVISGLRGPSHT